MKRALIYAVRLLAVHLVVLGGVFAQVPGNPVPADDAAPVDEAGRPVARLSLMNGDASVRRGDSGDWVAASLNAPLMVEDSVAVAPGGYAEVQFDNANFVRIAGDSEARISTLDSGRYGVQVIKGMVTFRVLRQTGTQAEVATPQVAVRPGPVSAVRVELLGDGYSRIEVRAGDVDVFTPQGVEKVRAGSMMMVRGTAAEPEFQISASNPLDEWDQFNQKRDADLLATKSPQYVSQDVYGSEDLDRYGQWGNDPQYGNVWAPTVPADWAPYRSGRWVWEDYYGWTWVAAEPWGWAPYHYGNWYYRGSGFGWCWYPGPIHQRYFWRPALVAFFGYNGGFGVGAGFGIGGGIGWVPLAPREIYHPWYGRGWYGGRNPIIHNVRVVNNTNILSVYRNARVRNGVSGLNAQEFASGRFHSIRPVGGLNLQSASLVRGALPLQPSQAHLGFADHPPSRFTPRVAPPQQNFPSRGFATAGGARGGFATNQRTPFVQQQSSFSNLNRAPERNAPASFGVPAASGWRQNSSPAAPSPQGWQRFGAPRAEGRVQSAPATPSGPSPAWRSFGRPQSADVPRQSSPGGVTPGASAPRASNPAQNYPRTFDHSSNVRPQEFRGGSSYSAPAPSNPRFGGGSEWRNGGGRSLQIAPPMVRERSSAPSAPRSSAPSFSRGGGNGGGNSSGGRNGGGGGGPSSHSSGNSGGGHSRR